MNIKIISWNIAGAHPIASQGHFDYSAENIDYFVEEIKKVNPDIICLQESHTSYDGKKKNSKEIADALGYQYFINSPASPSHVDEKYQLSTAIISKFPIAEQNVVFFPDPEVDLYWKNGNKAITHKKNMQVIKIKNFYVANNQMLPISLFGYTYDDTSFGGKLAAGINSVIENNVKTPLIWCGDFNYNTPLEIYPRMREMNLKGALPHEATRPSSDGQKKTPDHIFYSEGITLQKSEIIATNTDHYLCIAEFVVPDSPSS